MLHLCAVGATGGRLLSLLRLLRRLLLRRLLLLLRRRWLLLLEVELRRELRRRLLRGAHVLNLRLAHQAAYVL